MFDVEKLEWLNGEHLRALSPEAFAVAVLEHLEWRGSPLAARPERVREAAPLVQEKLRVLEQFEGMCGFLFGPVEIDPQAWAKVAGADAPRSLTAARTNLAAVEEWSAEPIEAALRAACETESLKPRVLYAPVRVAITGSTVSPGLYESLELLGRDESLARLDCRDRPRKHRRLAGSHRPRRTFQGDPSIAASPCSTRSPHPGCRCRASASLG